MQASVRSQRTGARTAVAMGYPQGRWPNRRLSVLHVGKYYPPCRGGMENYLQSLSKELKELVDLRLIVANDHRRTLRETSDGINLTRVSELCKFHSAPICPTLIRELREARADVIHLHWPNPTAVLAYFLSGVSGKLVFTYHSDVVRQRTLSALFLPLLRRALDKAAGIIVTSADYLASSEVLSHYGSKCTVIPLGVSLADFAKPDVAAVKQIQERYGANLVLAVGRLVYYKGFEHLVRAMSRINGTLLLIGDGPLRETLIRLAAALGIPERVAFLGDVDDVRPYYHAADIFVLSSVARSEAFGIVQLEAMACGKPVINTRLNSGVNFASPHGVSGLTVAPGNYIELSHAIAYLLERPFLRTKLGSRGHDRVAKHFTIQTMAQRTLELYRKVSAA